MDREDFEPLGAHLIHLELKPGVPVYDAAGMHLGEVHAIWERTATGELREVAGVEVLVPAEPSQSSPVVQPLLAMDGYLVVARGRWWPQYTVVPLSAILALTEMGVVVSELQAAPLPTEEPGGS